ncbi:hypothetical protein GCM10011608_20020 [Micromonospora sonchi]|uniref:Bacterial transcriptional activator domain-containing protein n=1 Tax=Micromonospora sonchi TaxID=1763543 RepID=A0A917TS15_9ACTN|nr:BTAD domain-containing putative transcriptional regulator [Micromonospora sonchi]GGM35371.1 hypothetical protein GCM10011608_20020 [Micromonospora sonchi]
MPSDDDPTYAPRLLRLLPVFSCTHNGVRRMVAPLPERVLSYLAVAYPTWVSRDAVIEACQLDGTGDPRARLRQVCWLLRSRLGFDPIVGDRQRIGISPTCRVDLHAAQEWCQLLLEQGFAKAVVRAVPNWLASALSHPLLADWSWDDAWLQPVQARWDVLRRETLDQLSGSLLAAGHHQQALICAHALIQQDPLRETAWEVLIEALIHSGQRAEARAQFDRLTSMLSAELGVHPSDSAHRLIADLYR